MRRAVVNDPENPAGLVLGRWRHDLFHQAVKRFACPFSTRNDRRVWHGEHRARRGRPKPHIARTRVPPAGPTRVAEGGWRAGDGVLGYGSSRRPKARIHRLAKAVLARLSPRNRGADWPWSPRRDRAEIPSRGAARGGWHLRGASGQTVRPDKLATRPLWQAQRASSPLLPRDRGQSWVAGSSPARALLSTTTCGGGSPRPPGARTLLETFPTLLEETFAPQADDLASGLETADDFEVGEARGSEQDHLGPEHLKIR